MTFVSHVDGNRGSLAFGGTSPIKTKVEFVRTNSRNGDNRRPTTSHLHEERTHGAHRFSDQVFPGAPILGSLVWRWEISFV